MRVLVLLAVCIALSAAGGIYEGQKVLRLSLQNEQQLQALQTLLDASEVHDVWSHDSNLVVGENNDVRVDEQLQQQIDQLGINYAIMIEDLQATITNDMQYNTKQKLVAADWFSGYHTYTEMVAYAKQLASTYPHLVHFIPSIGKSIEGRDIFALKINTTSNTNIKKIVWMSGQHAREWIAPATLFYITTQLLANHGKHTQVTQLLKDIEFHIIPMINPDGYEYTWAQQRLWRKNRRRNSDGSYGVDLNRNWDDHWGGGGSSGTPSSDTYRGTKAFSEPETLATSNYISKLTNVIGGIDFHAYGQLVLRPYGWTNNKCPDEESLRIIGDGVSYEIQRVHNKKYSSERAVQLYITTGASDDWMYGTGIWGVYCIELRDTGKNGFVLPASEIVPTGQEIWSSMLYWMTTVRDNYPH